MNQNALVRYRGVCVGVGNSCQVLVSATVPESLQVGIALLPQRQNTHVSRRWLVLLGRHELDGHRLGRHFIMWFALRGRRRLGGRHLRRRVFNDIE